VRKKPAESASEKTGAAVKDILGLPPADNTPHGQGRPEKDRDTPHGGLTSDDRPKRSRVTDNA
jgi:hypothetical protein